MEFDTYLRFILVLIFVLGLVLALGWVLKRSGISGSAVAGKGKRLGIVETAFLGPKHRLILVRRDEVEHLVLVGPNTNTLIESGIAADPKTRQSFKALVKAEEIKEERGQ
ncbi:FliO/MopB family protein [Dongia sp.]|uniref:FliO/MopB family protein n=1 Tax=Dongia sp. TaxID=1977262 RepID=UPI0037526FAD